MASGPPDGLGNNKKRIPTGFRDFGVFRGLTSKIPSPPVSLSNRNERSLRITRVLSLGPDCEKDLINTDTRHGQADQGGDNIAFGKNGEEYSHGEKPIPELVLFL